VIPWATVKDFKTLVITDTEEHITETAVSECSTRIVPPGTVLLVSRVGLGKAAIAGTHLAINQDIKGITPTPEVLPDYLLRFLLSRAGHIQRMGAGATVKGITLSDIKSIEMPLPSLQEQKRVVDLLMRAEGIVDLRRMAQQKAEELVPALFMEVFGDPVTNAKAWPVGSFGRVGQLDRGRSRHRPRDAKVLYGGPYPFIQTGDVANSGGSITRHTATYSEDGLKQSRLWQRGTLCITIAANIAKTGILTFEACFPDSVVGFLPGPQVRTRFVQAWLAFLQPTLEASAPQAAQKNINLEILRKLPIPLPPIELQEYFEQRCQQAISIQAQQAAALNRSTLLLDALLSRAFSNSPQ